MSLQNCHRHLANHATRQAIGDDDSDDNNDDDSDADDCGDLAKNVEERELMLLQTAKHVKMAREKRKLYQQKVADAVEDAKVRRTHGERRYTFVVYYGQNMELAIFNKEQLGVTYYYSPLSIYNLGVVNHAHVYDNGRVTEHLHAHVYHKGVGKKGANNVASLIVKRCNS